MNIADLIATLRLRPDKGSFDAADRMIGHVKKGLGVIAGFFAVDYVRNMVDQVVEAGDQVDEMSQKFGVGVEVLQELAHAASFSGLGISDIGQTLKFFGKNADAAAKGSKETAKAFKQVGLDAKKIVSGTLPIDEALVQVADKFKEMPDGTKKANLAMKLFGRQGQSLIPFLNEGSAGIQNLREEARELGIVLSAEDAKAMAEFADEQDKFKAGLKGVKIEIVKLLLPALQKIVVTLRNWFKANRKLIAQRIAQAAEILGKVFKVLATVLEKIFDIITENSDLAAAGVLAVVAAFVALRIASVGAAIAAGIAWAVANIEFVAIALVIMALILIVEDLFSWFEGGPSIFKDLYNAARDYLSKSTLGRILLDVFDAWLAGWHLMFSVWIASLQLVWKFVQKVVDVVEGAVDAAEKIAEGDVKGAITENVDAGDIADSVPVIKGFKRLGEGDVGGAIKGLLTPVPGTETILDGVGDFLGVSNPAAPGGAVGAPEVRVDGRRINLQMTVNGGDPNEVRRVVRETLDEEFMQAEMMEEGTSA